jgi:hypothetical protein
MYTLKRRRQIIHAYFFLLIKELREIPIAFSSLEIEGEIDRLTFWLHPPRAVADPILPCGWIFSEATRYAIRKDTRGVVGGDGRTMLTAGKEFKLSGSCN